MKQPPKSVECYLARNLDALRRAHIAQKNPTDEHKQFLTAFIREAHGGTFTRQQVERELEETLREGARRINEDIHLLETALVHLREGNGAEALKFLKWERFLYKHRVAEFTGNPVVSELLQSYCLETIRRAKEIIGLLDILERWMQSNKAPSFH